MATVRRLLGRSVTARDFEALLARMDRYWGLFRPSTSWRTLVSNVRLPATAEMHNAVASRPQMLRTSRGEVESLGKVIEDVAAMLHRASR